MFDDQKPVSNHGYIKEGLLNLDVHIFTCSVHLLQLKFMLLERVSIDSYRKVKHVNRSDVRNVTSRKKKYVRT